MDSSIKRLVLIVGIYYPEPSPTGRCAKQYVKLLEDVYEIDVIFIKSKTGDVNGKKVDGQRLFGLTDLRLNIENYFSELKTRSNFYILELACELAINLAKAVGKIQSSFYLLGNLRWFQKKAFKTLEAIHKENSVDVVFTVSSPFVAHIVGKNFKERYAEIKWITLTVDSFYAGVNKNKHSRKTKALLSEREVLNKADVNFVSEEIYKHGAEIIQSALQKTFSLPYLLPEPPTVSFYNFDANKINLVYAGRFYKEIRSPKFLLESFIHTCDDNLILHLYSASDCDELIDFYVKKSRGKIIRHAIVSFEKIQTILSSADILVTVGNSLIEFKPSKTFEYMSTGLPILNFYQNDLKDEILERYPLSAQISMNVDPIVAAAEIFEFCISAKDKKVNYADVIEIFQPHSANSVKNTILEKLL